MTGDQADFTWRLKSLLPRRWFPFAATGQPTATPILDACCAAIAYLLAQSYALIGYVRTQSRIATATDVWLDMISADFFGAALPRNAGENDTSFRARIEARLFRPVATREAISNAVTADTGIPPTLIEPWNPDDCGALAGAATTAGGGLAWGVGGCWGSTQLPGQFFVSAPHGAAIASEVEASVAETKAAGATAWINFPS